jgi:hypothetical protein
MSRKTTFAYLADTNFIAMPYVLSWEKIVRFAGLRKVDYIVLDRATWRNRLDQWKYLTQHQPNDPRVCPVYHDLGKRNEILIYKLLLDAPPLDGTSETGGRPQT